MIIRDLHEADGTAMLDFFTALPPGETTFMKDEQVVSPRVADWALQKGVIRLVAEGQDGAIEGYATIHPGVGMSAHVGEIRLIVAKSARCCGVGLTLARHVMVAGFSQAALSKLSVEVVAEQQGTIRMFSKLGFTPEALLRDHLRDADGEMHDLVILCHLAEDVRADFETLGIAGAK